MAIPEKISPLMMYGSLVIVTGAFILVMMSPFSPALHGLTHQQDPGAICLRPTADTGTMDSLWAEIVNRSRIDPGTVAFDELQLRTYPDGTIEELDLSIDAVKDRAVMRHQVSLRYDMGDCGLLTVSSSPAPAPQLSVYRSPQDPRAILGELAGLRRLDFGLAGHPAVFGADIRQTKNETMAAEPCSDLYLFENGTATRSDRINIRNAGAGAIIWNIQEMRCVDVPGNDPACFANRMITVIPGQQLAGIAIDATNTGNNQPATVYDCPAGTVEGRSCRSTPDGGETCVNWTA